MIQLITRIIGLNNAVILKLVPGQEGSGESDAGAEGRCEEGGGDQEDGRPVATGKTSRVKDGRQDAISASYSPRFALAQSVFHCTFPSGLYSLSVHLYMYISTIGVIFTTNFTK